MSDIFLPDINKSSIAVIGLGYVGLPLAVEFAKKTIDYPKNKFRKVIGFDINKKRINDLKNQVDVTNEIKTNTFNEAKGLVFSNEPVFINDADIFIITVPTPITSDNNPDLQPLINSTKTVAEALISRKNRCKPIIILSLIHI